MDPTVVRPEVGVDAHLEVWSGMWHDFQGFTGMLPEATRAVASVGTFLSEKLR